MIKNYEETPTFLVYSEKPVGLIAGGGMFGFGGIMLHEPTDKDFSKICTDAELETAEPKGIGFNYSDVATVTVSGLLKWTNSFLDRAPEGRQDVRETGPVRIELFDEEESRQYVEKQSKLLEILGIKFIG